MIPGLNDHELPSILEAASEAGASFGFYSLVRLPGAVESIFGDWLERHFPDGKEKILARIREYHGGARNQNIPGVRMRGRGGFASQLNQLFMITARRLGLETGSPALRTGHVRHVLPGQGELF
jgi:DNA repair photolyase